MVSPAFSPLVGRWLALAAAVDPLGFAPREGPETVRNAQIVAPELAP
jgi:hypothetical protein